MSYILDALRKAEAERGRGAVPGVHAQQGPDVPAPSSDRRVKILGWTVAVLAVVLALGGTLAWRAMDRGPDGDAARELAGTSTPPAATIAQAPVPSETAPGAASTAPVVPAMPTPTPTPTPTRSVPVTRSDSQLAAAPSTPPARTAAATAGPSPTSTATSPPAALEQPRAVPLHPTPRTQTSAQASTQPQPLPQSPRVQQQEPALQPVQPQQMPMPQQPASPTPTPSPNATPQVPRIYATNELPDAIRSALPQYSVNGASYSENPAARLLIVNGQVAREGDTLPGGAALEQIKLRAAVLRFRGYRYELSY